MWMEFNRVCYYCFHYSIKGGVVVVVVVIFVMFCVSEEVQRFDICLIRKVVYSVYCSRIQNPDDVKFNPE